MADDTKRIQCLEFWLPKKEYRIQREGGQLRPEKKNACSPSWEILGQESQSSSWTASRPEPYRLNHSCWYKTDPQVIAGNLSPTTHPRLHGLLSGL